MNNQTITSVEKYKFEEKAVKESKVYYHSENYPKMTRNFRNEHNLFVLKRYLIKDNFNIQVWRYYASNESSVPFININNKIVFYNQDDNPGYTSRLNNQTSFYYHHSVLDETKFKNISTITCGNELNIRNKKSILGTLLKEDNTYKEKFISDFNHVIELRSIKRLTFLLENIESSLPFSTDDNAYRQRVLQRNVGLNVGYNHIFIKPIKPNRLETTSTVAEVYSYNDDGTDVQYDLKVPDGKVKVSSTNKEMNTYFEPVNSNKQLPGHSLAKLKGYIKIEDSSYYDYDSKKTIIGTLHGATFGDTIPFNFKGDYSWILKSSFNSAFKDVNMTFTTNYKTPILDKTEGNVILNLNQTTKTPPIGITLATLSEHDTKLIRNNDYSLVGIKRMLND